MDSDQVAYDMQTIQFYDRIAEEYGEWSGNNRSYAFLRQFMKQLPDSSKVLDAGCGSGWDSEQLVNSGFNVTSIDASLGQVQMANQRIGVTAQCQRFDQIQSTNEFDGIWANSSLQHVEYSKFPTLLQQLTGLLKHGGLFYIIITCGTQKRRDKFGRLYCQYTEEKMTELMSNAKLHVDTIKTENATNYDGSKTKSLLIHCCKL